MAKRTTTKPAKKPAGAKKCAPSGARSKGAGRPSTYSEQMAKAVCGWIAQGYTLREIDALPNMPSKTTILRWLAEHEEFRDHYARAREVQAYAMEDEILEIAEDSRNDWVMRQGKDGESRLVFDEERVSRARVRIDARKWLMAKMAPKRYGDRVAVTGKDGGPVKHVHQTVSDILDDIDGAGTGLPAHGRRD